jgi:simple sugar transport system ATP-binding protein
VRPAAKRELLRSFRDLSVKGDRGETAVRGISFELHRGEILGFGGVDGNGQVELAEHLAGVRGPNPEAGSVAYIPQDRQIDGLALNMTVEENMTITGQRSPAFTRGPFLLLKELRAWAIRLIEQFDIRVPGPRSVVGSLSGGNQQKVVVSRALASTPDLVVAVNPTRGLDFRAAEFVRQQLLGARDSGAAVALFTTDLDELFEVSDRQVFMSGGPLLTADSASALLGSEA